MTSKAVPWPRRGLATAERSPDTWEFIEPLDAIRERKEPFRDEKGKIVPPGALGKYFETRDQDGTWRAVNPVDIGAMILFGVRMVRRCCRRRS